LYYYFIWACIYYGVGQSGTIVPFLPSASLIPPHTQLTDGLQIQVIIQFWFWYFSLLLFQF